MGTDFFQNGDPKGTQFFSEMGTKWGPSPAKMGTQKGYVPKIDRNYIIYWNKGEKFWEKNITQVWRHLVHTVCSIFIINTPLRSQNQLATWRVFNP